MPCRTPNSGKLFCLLLKYSRQSVCFPTLGGWGRLSVLDYGGYASMYMHCCPQEHREEAMNGRLHCIVKMKNFMFLIEDMIGCFNESMSC